jgi:Gamma-glutamyl cyclotransferase, AIG2-like
MRFFFYGTLLDRDVTMLVLGRRLPPDAFVPAALPGHDRRKVKGASYPIVVRDPKSEVAGAIVGGLSARDVARLAAYEGPRYRIAPLKVRIAGAMSIVSVFEPVEERFQPTSSSWDLTSWQRRYKRAFLARIRPALSAILARSRQ